MPESSRRSRPIILIATVFYVSILINEIKVLQALSQGGAPSVGNLADALFVLFSATVMYVMLLRCIRIIRIQSELIATSKLIPPGQG